MGWLNYHRPAGETDREHFTRRLLTEGTHDVLADATIDNTWYAAVKDNRTNEVFALVILTEYYPGERENFAYKAMDETVGPVKSDAPAAVLDALTPTTSTYALDWRERCRTALAS
jgi:hypothetical protein